MTLQKLVSFIFILQYYSCQSQVDSNYLFERSKGKWIFPLANVSKIISYDTKKKINDLGIANLSKSTIFIADNSYSVNAIYGGTVVGLFDIQGSYVIVTKYGKYFLTYAGLKKPTIKIGDYVNSGQSISNIYMDKDNAFVLEVFLHKEGAELDPYYWFKNQTRRITAALPKWGQTE